MPSLEGPREKLRRAVEHLKTLRFETDEFLALNPYSLAFDIDQETGQHVGYMKVQLAAPLRLGVMIGDIVHNLRTSLDHLAWQLALKKVARPSEKTAFPIHAHPDRVTNSLDKRGRQAICDLPHEAQKIIESIQPYRSHDPGQILLALNLLSRTDKHQIIIGPLPQFTGAVITGIERNATNPDSIRILNPNAVLDNGDKVVTFSPSALNLREDYKVEPHWDVGIRVFDRPAQIQSTATAVLHRIYKAISNDVLPRFEQFF